MATLWDLFHDSSYKNADCKCVIHHCPLTHYQRFITYKQMYSLINKAEKYFIEAANAVNCDKVLGITCSDVSPECLVIILTSLKCKFGFIFIDENMRENQQRKLIEKLSISLCIAEQGSTLILLFQQIFTKCKVVSTFILLGTTFELWSFESDGKSSNDKFIYTQKYAYAIQTSGSTSEPKIIRVPDSCIIPNIMHFRDVYRMKEDDVVFLSAPLTFDPSVLDIFLAFSSGASVFLVQKEIKIEPNSLFHLMFLNGPCRVTVLSTTPSLWCRWSIHTINQIRNTTLRILALGGECFPSMDVVRNWNILDKILIYNLYGITEVSCWASYCCINELVEDDIPLGVAVKDTVLQVRDELGNMITSGTGEMFIGSYIRRCTVDNEYNPDNFKECCFRKTGDLVEVRNGNYYFRGRKDRIIKLYGHQVDLTAMEKKTLQTRLVTQCCCFYIPVSTRIVIMVKLVDTTTSKQDVISQLRRMFHSEFSVCPSDIVPVSDIPLNKHGKVSEKLCRELCSHLTEFDHGLDIEDTFYRTWAKYCSKFVSTSSSNCSQFGGDSILAVQFIAELSMVCDSLPNDLIVYLLTNKTAEECLTLLKSHRNQIIGSCTRISQKLIDAESAEAVNEYNQTDDIIKHRSNGIREERCRGRINCYAPENKSENYQIIPSKIKISWKHYLGKCVDASPLLLVYGSSECIIICGSHSGHLVIINVEGIVLSECILPDRVESSACSSLDGRYIYVGCYDGNLYSIKVQNGSIQWKFATEDIIKCSPRNFQSRLYFGSYDHRIYCISEDGLLLWRNNIDDSSIYASIEVHNDNYLFAATLGGSLACFDVSGNSKYICDFTKPIFAAPVVVTSIKACIVVDVTGIVHCCCLQDGSVLWNYQVGGNVFSSPVVNHCNGKCEIIFGCYDKNVHCLTVSNNSATPAWKSAHNAPIYSTPFLCGGLVVSVSIDGCLNILDSNNGDVITTYELKGQIFSSPAVYRHNLFVGCRDDYLYCLNMSL